MIRPSGKFLFSLLCLWALSFPVFAAVMSDIRVENSEAKSVVSLRFTGKPTWSWFMLHNPERFVLDLRQRVVIKGLPLNFRGSNLVKRIRGSQPPDTQTIRLVFELTRRARAMVAPQQTGQQWQVNITLTGDGTSKPVADSPLPARQTPAPQRQTATVTNNHISSYPGVRLAKNQVVIVAIDAGHGGQDPGAIGQHGLKEKNVTLAIARKLYRLLATDPNFKPVMTRSSDRFISVMGRSEVARKDNASLLISIHADSAPVRSARGASVWVLSNRRANSEMANWLEQTEKQSELLGGAGDLLANSQSEPYLSQAVLDLQFGHSQRVGYDVAVKVLQQLRGVILLHKKLPEHASLGVLRSPDIPSLLVETGFISNLQEERLLGTNTHQTKIAQAIYQGLRRYFRTHPYQYIATSENRPLATETNVTPAGNSSLHIVQRGETLQGIAAQYGISISQLSALNQLKKPGVWLGQHLRVPVKGGKDAVPTAPLISYKVVRGDSLNGIARKYRVSPEKIMQQNQLKSSNVMLGQTLKIPVN